MRQRMILVPRFEHGVNQLEVFLHHQKAIGDASPDLILVVVVLIHFGEFKEKKHTRTHTHTTPSKNSRHWITKSAPRTDRTK